MISAPSLLLLVQTIATGSISGTLRDGVTNEPLGGAVIAVLDLNRSAVADADGRYRFDRVPPGTHALLVRRIGYAPRTLEALVPAGGSVDITVALRAEPIVLGVVDGTDQTPLSLPPDRQVDMAAIRGHPLLAEPDVFQALSGGIVSLQPESPAGMHVRGGASDQVSYLLDGFPVFDPYHSGESFSAWNPDALAGAELHAAAEGWDALSGVVAASSRTPGREHHVRTGVSTTQMRATLDGPLGSGGAGYLWSARMGFPGFPMPQRESTYLRSETGDRLAKLEGPLAGGRFRVLGYANANELDTDGPPGSGSRNLFEWQSTTIGGEWSRPMATGLLRARVWTAGGNANATWHVDNGVERLATSRHDAGVAVTLERSGQRGRTTLGGRVQASRMSYHASTDSNAATRFDSRAPLATLFVERTQLLGADIGLASGLTITGSGGAVRLSPRVSLRWSPLANEALTVSGSYVRQYQYSQSLRNPESVAGAVFPVDLFVTAPHAGVPIARSDQGSVAAEYRLPVRLRLSAQGYVRSFTGLVLVAPGNPDPFAITRFAVGSGAARGLTLELARTTARFAVVASYSHQYVRFAAGGVSYTPDYVARQAVDAGVVLNAWRHLSLRFSGSGRFGRHVTPLVTPFEWESCNVTDRGCEFAGSPRTSPDSLGATTLPGYVRVDFGARSQWSVRFAGRTTELAFFATLTNLLARSNLLTVAPDPVSGIRSPVTLRSRVPLVIGFDWSF